MWPVALKEYEKNPKINMYTFIDHVNKFLGFETAVVADAGSAYYVTAQALKIKDQQRYITSGAQADMGFTLPASIGVSIAKEKGDVVAITGEGSFQMNLQELQTIVQNKLPIKLFIWNNNGYLSIRTTQKKFFEGRIMGTEEATGISFPDVEKIAFAYNIPFFRVASVNELDKVLEKVFAKEGPILCEVVCPEDQEVIPTVSSAKRPDGSMVSKPIEDMYPFLDREEFTQQMIIKPLDE
jgi:acetolactate synthase-1/2/3 large subunit